MSVFIILYYIIFVVTFLYSCRVNIPNISMSIATLANFYFN